MSKPKREFVLRAVDPADGEATSDRQLESLVSRIVRLEEEKREMAETIKGIYCEAKAKGYNVKALRIVVKRQLETDEKRIGREENEAEAALMESRLGVLATLPLGQVAIAKAHSAEAH